MSTSQRDFDLVVVGSGPMGAIVAHQVRQALPNARIVMVEAGPPLGDRPGTHLSDASDPALRQIFRSFMAYALQHNYVELSDDEFPAVMRAGYTTPAAGVVPAARLGFETIEMPGASAAWNTGGMGIHWTAACPLPGPWESVEEIEPATWSDQIAVAYGLLQATTDAFVTNPIGPAVLDAIGGVVKSTDPARQAQNLPMAGRLDEDRNLRRTGPCDIFPPIGDGGDHAFTLLSDTLCVAVDMAGSRARGIRVRDMNTGQESVLTADVVVLAADALRTPQLMFASGIRPEALGCYLNDHISLSTRTTVDPARLGMPDAVINPSPLEEPFVGAYWLPSCFPEQPFHGQLMEIFDGRDEHQMSITLYITTEVQASNRVTFDSVATDCVGMPRPRIAFSYTQRDLAQLAPARILMRRLARAIGPDERPETLMIPGGSLHYTGTVRMGATNDGTSVCDLGGRVWDTDNLYVVGNGVVPFPLSCNCTLTSAALTVGIARRVREALA